MARVKDSEKNKERVERKLRVKNLFVCLDREGFATFYNDDIPIIFHSGNQKSKEKEDSKGEFCLKKLEKVENAQSKSTDEVIETALNKVYKEENLITISKSEAEVNQTNEIALSDLHVVIEEIHEKEESQVSITQKSVSDCEVQDMNHNQETDACGSHSNVNENEGNAGNVDEEMEVSKIAASSEGKIILEDQISAKGEKSEKCEGAAS